MSGRVQSEKQNRQERGPLEDLAFCSGGSWLHSSEAVSFPSELGPEGCRAGKWEGKVGRKSWNELELIPVSRDWDLHQSLFSKAPVPRGCSQSQSPSSLNQVCMWLRAQGSLKEQKPRG